jgi:hypothetical protein
MSGFEHFGEELKALEERLGRLALACGVNLGDRTVVASLIRGDFGVCGRGSFPKRDELRALLMLKYRIEAKCIDALGAGDCLRIVDQVDAELARRGFPGNPAPAA